MQEMATTALDEMAQRIQVLRRQAADDREDAERAEESAARLRSSADHREALASQYERLADVQSDLVG